MFLCIIYLEALKMRDFSAKKESVEWSTNPNDQCECGSTHCTFKDLGGYAYPIILRTCLDCGKVAEYVDLYRQKVNFL